MRDEEIERLFKDKDLSDKVNLILSKKQDATKEVSCKQIEESILASAKKMEETKSSGERSIEVYTDF